MQLTILLELLHQQGMAIPTQRTELYDSYMNLLLAREANKHPDSVRKHRSDLLEMVPFLGWYLQSRSEQRDLSGRMTIAELNAAMRHFQRTYGKSESVVDELFEATTDRLWALTSKDQGLFEFEVLSLREYFAARYLYKAAGEGNRTFDHTRVVRELMRRPYWLNTARFYAGNAHGSDVFILAAGVKEELREEPVTHSYIAAWTMLVDGAFASRPAEAAGVLEELCSDIGASILLAALDRNELSPLPDLPLGTLSNPTWNRLTAVIEKNPSDSFNYKRVRLLRELLSLRGEFGRWWQKQLESSIGGANERAWLKLGSSCEAGAGLQLNAVDIDLTLGGAEALLNTGMIPPSGSDIETTLLAAVLDGQCANVRSIRSLPAQVAVALSPQAFYTTSSTGFNGQSEDDNRRRQEAVRLLRRTAPDFADVAAQRKFKTGEKGSTFPWANTAAALAHLVGRCWLASEIAIIGAASKHLTGVGQAVGSEPFGPNAHPATLLGQCRANARRIEWWIEQRDLLGEDELAAAEWVLAARTVAGMHTEAREVFNRLSAETRRVIDDATRRIQSWAEDVANSGQKTWSDDSPTGVNESEAFDTNIVDLPPLAVVATDAKWLQVDQVALYR